MSFRYLSPHQSKSVAVHRHLLLRGRSHVPRLAWWSAQALAAARWLSVGARTTYISEWISACAVRVANDEGIAVDEQRRRIAPLIRSGILPNEIYELGLYRPDAPGWERYIYNRESGSFNEFRSRPLGSVDEYLRQRDQLSDKQVTAHILSTAGVVAVPTLALLTAGDAAPNGDQPLFIKPRSAFGGRGSYALLPTSDHSIASIRPWRSAVARPLTPSIDGVVSESMIVQPLLRTDPALDLMSHGATLDVPTLRIITNSPQSDEPPIWHALLELARTPLTDDLLTYYALDLDEAGTLMSLHIPPWIDRSTYVRDHSVVDAIGTQLPGWAEAHDSAVRAHTLFPNVHSIAWDVALTDEGPILLEGNTAFSVIRHQALRGPLLSE